MTAPHVPKIPEDLALQLETIKERYIHKEDFIRDVLSGKWSHYYGLTDFALDNPTDFVLAVNYGYKTILDDEKEQIRLESLKKAYSEFKYEHEEVEQICSLINNLIYEERYDDCFDYAEELLEKAEELTKLSKKIRLLN